jgi:hypothetical protein
MIDERPGDARPTPRDTAEGEEQDVLERSASERGPGEREARRAEDDPREDEGWAQPESSAQKGAVRDEG